MAKVESSIKIDLNNITQQEEHFWTVPAFTMMDLQRWDAKKVYEILLYQVTELNQFKAVKDEFWHTLFSDWKSDFDFQWLTIVDAFSNREFSDHEKMNLLKLVLWNDSFNINKSATWVEFNKKTMDKINEILNEAISFYENTLLYKLPDTFFNLYKWDKNWRKLNLKNGADVFRFFDQSAKNPKAGYRQIHCDLLKISYIVALMKQYPQLKEMEKPFEDIIRWNFFSWLWLFKKPWTNMDKSKTFFERLWDKTYQTNYEIISNKTVWWISTDIKPRDIHFSMNARPKSWDSWILKLLYNPEYDEADAIKDFMWMRAEVSTQEEAILLLQYIYYYSFKWKWNIIDKWMLEINWISKNDFLSWISKELDSNFLELLKWLKSWNGKSSTKYKDIKVEWPIELNWVTHNVEFQIVLVNNKNESWYSHHWIFDAKKRIDACIRLRGYITEKHIIRHIIKAIDENPEFINSFWNWDKNTAIRKIYYHMLSQWKLVELSIPGQSEKKTYFTSKWRWNALNFIKQNISNSLIKCIRFINKTLISKWNMSYIQLKELIRIAIWTYPDMLKIRNLEDNTDWNTDIDDIKEKVIHKVIEFINIKWFFELDSSYNISLKSQDNAIKIINEMTRQYKYYPSWAQIRPANNYIDWIQWWWHNDKAK